MFVQAGSFAGHSLNVLVVTAAGATTSLPPVAVMIGVAVALVPRHGDRRDGPHHGDYGGEDDWAEDRAGARGRPAEAGSPGEPQPAREAVLLARRDGLAATRALRHRSASTAAASSIRLRPQLGQKRAPMRIGAPHAQMAAPRRRRPRAPWRRASISLARASIATSSAHRSTIQRLVEVVAPVHLEREAAELVQAVLARRGARDARAAGRSPPARRACFEEETHRCLRIIVESFIERRSVQKPGEARSGILHAAHYSALGKRPTRQLDLNDDEPLLGHLADGPRRALARVARSP